MHLRFDIRVIAAAGHQERLLALPTSASPGRRPVIKAQTHRSQEQNRAEAWAGCRSWWTASPSRRVAPCDQADAGLERRVGARACAHKSKRCAEGQE